MAPTLNRDSINIKVHIESHIIQKF